MAKELSQQTLFNFFKSVNQVKQSAVPNMPAPLLKVANEAVQKENQKAPANREEIGPIELGKRGCINTNKIYTVFLKVNFLINILHVYFLENIWGGIYLGIWTSSPNTPKSIPPQMY